MPTADEQLSAFLDAYTPGVQAVMRAGIDRVDGLVPHAVRMVFENANATVLGYTPDGHSRHAVCSLAAYPRWVNLFLFAGNELPDPYGLLDGTGSTVRRVRLRTPDDLDDRVAALVGAAVVWSPWPFDPSRPTTTVVASVSDRRRPRRP